MSSFLQQYVEAAKDDLLSFASEKKHAGEITGLVDTGCYILNAMLSGSLYGGLPNNRSTAFAGDQGCGKTYLALGIVRNFLDADPKAGVVYYDTEGSVTTEMMEERGIDSKRVLMSEVLTIEDFRTKCKRLLEAYKAVPEGKRTPLLIVLDSLGMLSSNKEVSDIEEGKDVRDMTKAGLIKGAFRVLTLLMAKLKVPLILTNHTYAVVGAYVPTKEMSGGSGAKYAASTIIYFSKSKDRDGTEVKGVFLKGKVDKGRLSKENTTGVMTLNYQTGLDKYSGLLELGEKHGVFKKTAGRYEINGAKVFAKAIHDNPDKYFTKEVMDQLEIAAQKEYKYGVPNDIEEETEQSE